MTNTDPYYNNNYLMAGQGITISNSGGGTYSTIDMELSNSKDFKDLMSRIEGIEKRLAILRPNWELQARFPALLEAYEHYKTIEKLVNDQNSNMLIK